MTAGKSKSEPRRPSAPKAEPARPVGRPTKYDPALCEQVVEAGRQGMSKAEIAADLDITRQTLDTWSKAHPDFLDALLRANDLSLAWWEKQARTNLATSGYQAGLWKQAMSGRFPSEPYRERQEVSGPGGGPVQLTRIELVAVAPRDDSEA